MYFCHRTRQYRDPISTKHKLRGISSKSDVKGSNIISVMEVEQQYLLSMITWPPYIQIGGECSGSLIASIARRRTRRITVNVGRDIVKIVIQDV